MALSLCSSRTHRKQFSEKLQCRRTGKETREQPNAAGWSGVLEWCWHCLFTLHNTCKTHVMTLDQTSVYGSQFTARLWGSNLEFTILSWSRSETLRPVPRENFTSTKWASELDLRPQKYSHKDKSAPSSLMARDQKTAEVVSLWANDFYFPFG